MPLTLLNYMNRHFTKLLNPLPVTSIKKDMKRQLRIEKLRKFMKIEGTKIDIIGLVVTVGKNCDQVN